MYAAHGWVANDVHSEAGSRTLDYACKFSTTTEKTASHTRVDPDDDYAISQLAHALAKPDNATAFHARSMSAPFTIYNTDTNFMEARSADGSWAGADAGWTEGDKWAYSFDVVHAVPELIAKRGGNASFVESLDAHFDGGHNDHSNEVRFRRAGS